MRLRKAYAARDLADHLRVDPATLELALELDQDVKALIAAGIKDTSFWLERHPKPLNPTSIWAQIWRRTASKMCRRPLRMRWSLRRGASYIEVCCAMHRWRGG